MYSNHKYVLLNNWIIIGMYILGVPLRPSAHPAPSSPDVKSSTKNRPFTNIKPPKSIKILHPLCLLPRSAVWTGPPSRHTSRRRSARTNSGRPRGARQRPLRSPRRAGDPRLGRLGHGTMRDSEDDLLEMSLFCAEKRTKSDNAQKCLKSCNSCNPLGAVWVGIVYWVYCVPQKLHAFLLTLMKMSSLSGVSVLTSDKPSQVPTFSHDFHSPRCRLPTILKQGS